MKIARPSIIFSSIEKCWCTDRFIVLFLFGFGLCVFSKLLSTIFQLCIVSWSQVLLVEENYFLGKKKNPLTFSHKIVLSTFHHGLESASHHTSLMLNSVTLDCIEYISPRTGVSLTPYVTNVKLSHIRLYWVHFTIS